MVRIADVAARSREGAGQEAPRGEKVRDKLGGKTRAFFEFALSVPWQGVDRPLKRWGSGVPVRQERQGRMLWKQQYPSTGGQNFRPPERRLSPRCQGPVRVKGQVSASVKGKGGRGVCPVEGGKGGERDLQTGKKENGC